MVPLYITQVAAHSAPSLKLLPWLTTIEPRLTLTRLVLTLAPGHNPSHDPRMCSGTQSFVLCSVTVMSG